jgi:hypothetical protein
MPREAYALARLFPVVLQVDSILVRRCANRKHRSADSGAGLRGPARVAGLISDRQPLVLD